ncbi:hypothetical protein [Amycolatopsis regifaucium]|uniref:hypothetical protein n=1 Tax=Amycolatopsis regifaucium TaxID=546365 RepID=UPI0008F66B99|nr:hypothetical protein [Amycolatopsis regifaucium]SFH57785.1 hypothetical protein SAMN04489731_10590 [Amycolatopsis regifaucium]
MSTPTDVKDPIGEEEPVDAVQSEPGLPQHEHSPDCEHNRNKFFDCAGGCIQTPPPRG